MSLFLTSTRGGDYHFFVKGGSDSELNGKENTSPRKRKVLNLVTSWGGPGSGNSELNDPQAVDSKSTYVYVADTGNYRVQKFTTTGGYLTQFRPNYGAPRDVAVDTQGNVYVMFVSLSNTPIEKWKMTSSTLAEVKIFYSGKTAGSSAGLLFHGGSSIPSKASKKTPAENISQRQTEQESRIKD